MTRMADCAESSLDEPASLGQSHCTDIFISYRVRPDEELAGELKTLLEGAIEPKPQVFVSGLGGLRASADGYREQLRAAARATKAYVGLITKESIDREWIFFEAGAAFGRNVLYAPVLVDVSPGELPTSVGGYQATLGRDQSRMHEFVKDVARAIGSQVKPNFGNRFGRFAKAVEAYGRAPTEDLAGLQLAVSLLESGKKEEAEALFGQLEEAEGDPEEKARIRGTKLIFSEKDRHERLALFENQPPAFRETAIFKLWLGNYETSPVRAVQLLRDAYDSNLKGFLQQVALEALTNNEYQLGHTRLATNRLLAALRQGDRKVKALASCQLANHVALQDNTLKLVLLTEALLDGSCENLDVLSRYCWEKKFISVGLYVATRSIERKVTGKAHLTRGLVRALAGYKSLAFQDYRIAAEHNISVAKSNMASALKAGPVAEAGLEILRSHTGDYDSADRASPYLVRAELERLVQDERQQEEKQRAYGQRVVGAVQRLVDTWRRRVDQTRTDFESRSGTWMLRMTGGTLSLVENGTDLVVRELAPLTGLFAGFTGAKLRILVCFGLYLEAVVFDDLDGSGELEWLELPFPDASVVA